MKQILLSLMIGVGSSLIANAAFGAQFYEDANLSRLDNTINEAKTMWDKWAKPILVDNDQEKTKDLIIERFKVAEDQFKNNWNEYVAWNLETHFCCALALLKHAKMDLSNVLFNRDSVKDGFQKYLGLCIRNLVECKRLNMTPSIGDGTRRAGLAMYMSNLGKLFAKMGKESNPIFDNRVVSTLTKLIVWSVYSARKEKMEFKQIVEEKEAIFYRSVRAFKNERSTKKPILPSLSQHINSPKMHKKTIDRRSYSPESVTEIVAEENCIQSVLQPVPKDLYCVEYYSPYF